MRRLLILSVIFLIYCVYSFGYAQTETSLPVVFGEWTYVPNDRGITITDYRGDTADLGIPYELDGHPVTRLGKGCFRDNLYLRSVIIAGSVTAIESDAFNGCLNLEEVRLSYDIKKIETGTFRNCYRLKSIYIPDDVRSIGNYAFENCHSLEEVYLTLVSSVGESAFDHCENLSRIIYSKKLTTVGSFAFRDTAWVKNYDGDYIFIGKGVLIGYKGNDLNPHVPFGAVKITTAFTDNENIESVYLPESVREIGKNAFRNAVNLKSINIQTYVNKIDNNAFEGCRSLDNVVLNRLLTSIGSSAFQGCEKLTSITIPPRVKTINSMTFADCPALAVVSLPDTVTKIDKKAFQGSDTVSLLVNKGSYAERFAKETGIAYDYPTKIFDNSVIHTVIESNNRFDYTEESGGIHIKKYTGNHAIVEVPERIDGKTVIAIGKSAFQHNGCVQRVILPETILTIGDYSFANMDHLENVQMPTELRSLGNYAFTGSSNLRQVQLPRRLREIGEGVFDPSGAVMICAGEGTNAARLLTAYGFDVLPYGSCSFPEDPYADVPRPKSCSNEKMNEDWEIVQIPAGLRVLTADLLRNLGSQLILFIPTSIEEIEEGILDGRSIMIASMEGTAAETFSREHGIHFVSQ